MSGRVLSIGHRGGTGHAPENTLATGHAPENTLAAVKEGIAQGADYVEIDIQLTADNKLVVMHDKRVDRTTNGTGAVADLTMGELQMLDAGNGEHIPELSEVLHAVNGHAGLMAEIITPGIAADVVSAVLEFALRTPVIFASFLHSELLTVRRVLPEAQTLALLEGVPIAGAQFAIDAEATHVGLGFDSATEAFVRELHSKKLAVFVYTLDDPQDIKCAQAWGVDGIISNYPKMVSRIADQVSGCASTKEKTRGSRAER